ncbi:MAG: hypothetical protein CBC27_07900 [Opitutia bacterium TMED67]|jgi:hypothetical protein|nr:hypothetical protein [Verrucomicrobiales bacterium]OUU70933.1 MAG: hypothetical protein CBC27_07900 [Opitutae bacterium TMED67]RZO60518.1 MAG: DoxX family protein [Limisphaerales bacterium]|tara:strand:- start:2929 stop:3288 length:360 start_codon:yes stop_codon:yes gene_type:complete
MTTLLILKLSIPLIILSVWLIRPNSITKFRGGNAKTLKEEFHFYGLNSATFYLVGTIKIVLSLLLIMSIWNENLLLYSSLGIATLMLCATFFHLRSKDSLTKTSPSFILFVLSLFIAVN